MLQVCALPLRAGYTGHISGPSAEFQAYMDPALTVAVNVAKEKDPTGARPPTLIGIGLINGFLKGNKFNAESGFDYKSCGGNADDNPLYLNAKAGFPEGALGEGMPALAGGAFDVGTNGKTNDYNVLYGLASKTIRLGAADLGKFSAGWFAGSADLLLDRNGSKDNSGLLAAWARVVPEISENLWASVDYLGTASAYGSWNFGLAWKFNSKVSAIAGYNIFTDKDLVDTFNVQLTLGLGGDAK
jgi:hypothetical protein